MVSGTSTRLPAGGAEQIGARLALLFAGDFLCFLCGPAQILWLQLHGAVVAQTDLRADLNPGGEAQGLSLFMLLYPHGRGVVNFFGVF